MKKSLKVLILMTLCLFASFLLIACEGIFDGLNFNRRKLPDNDKAYDELLVNEYPRGELELSSSELKELFDSSTRETLARKEKLTINYYPIAFASFPDYVYSTVINYQQKTEEEPPNNQPYASVTEESTSYIGTSVEELYFYPNCFTVQSSSGANGVSASARYEIDAYLEEIPLRQYDIVKSGSYLRLVFSAFEESFDGAYSDFHNGTAVLLLTLKAKICDELVQFFPNNYDVPIAYGRLLGHSALRIHYEDNQISYAVMSLEYQYGKIEFILTIDFEVDLAGLAPSGDIILPSYAYTLEKAIASYYTSNDWFNKKAPQYKATVAYENYNLFNNLLKSGEFVYYNTLNQACSNDESWTVAPFVRVVEMENETIYNAKFSYSEYLFVEEGHNLTGLTQGSADYARCSGIVSEVGEFFKGFIHWTGGANFVFELIETNDGYRIVISHKEFGFDEEGEIEIVLSEISMEFEISRDFSRLFSCELLAVSEGEIIEKRQVEFSYDFEVEIPSAVFSNPYIW